MYQSRLQKALWTEIFCFNAVKAIFNIIKLKIIFRCLSLTVSSVVLEILNCFCIADLIKSWGFLFCFLKIWSHYIIQAGLDRTVLLLPAPAVALLLLACLWPRPLGAVSFLNGP